MTVSELARLRAPGFLTRGLDSLEDRYGDTLARILDQPSFGPVAGTVSVILLLLLGWIAGRSAFQDVGPAGKPIRIEIKGPDAATLAGVTRRVADEVREVRGAVDVTSQRAGDHRTRIEAGVYARGPREALKEIESVLADLPLPPGYELETSRSGAGRVTALAGLAGILLAILIGAIQAAAMVRIDNRRRVRGDTARVAAAVAAQRRFSPNVMTIGILLVLAGFVSLAGNAVTTAFSTGAAASLTVVLLGLLYVMPALQSLRPAAAR